MNFDILIMAAGLGKRMKSTIPKPVIPVLNKPMLVRILDTISTLDNLPDTIYIITNHISYNVILEACRDKIPFCLLDRIHWLKQLVEPCGTGSSVQEAIKQINIKDKSKPFVILSSDVPMISKETIQRLLENSKSLPVANILTTVIDNPTGYGRIISNNGSFLKIVEQKDASIAEKAINVVNTGIYCISYSYLENELFSISNINASNEYYLTDLFGILKNDRKVVTLTPHVPTLSYELFNINTSEQLEELEALITGKN
jgi:bifunctional UDP-N-acetylglucosamine pyrophosphorylase / glucosamine-1-phosphate N-acetyltransferase